MKTIQENILTYNELSDEAKAKARDWFREASRDDTFYTDCVIDNMKEVAVELGIEIDKIYFSGFSSQGDGAMFIGRFRLEDVNYGALETYPYKGLLQIGRGLAEIQGIASDKGVTVSGVTSHRGRYFDELSMTVSLDVDADDWEVADEFSRDYSDKITELLRDFACFIYRELEREYDYSMSDEAVSENIIANEYEFYEDGRKY